MKTTLKKSQSRKWCCNVDSIFSLAKVYIQSIKIFEYAGVSLGITRITSDFIDALDAWNTVSL